MRTVIEVAEGVRRGELKAVEVLDQSLTAIEQRNGAVNAFVHLDADLARRAAERVDAAVARGDDPGPLAGVPFGVNDLEDCAGMPTSYGSLLFKGRPPVEQDSVQVLRLRAAGAVPVGKTAAPEFGAYPFTETRAWGTTRNPWELKRTPGGASGGAAAAVAAGMVPFCTGSDGGGSIRIPASFSGLVGLKPTFGRVPHPKAGPSQTSALGALATTVADAARHLDVAAGPDDRDRCSLPPPPLSYEDAAEHLDVNGLRLAWSPDLGFAAVDPEVRDLARVAAEALAEVAGLRLDQPIVAFTDPVKAWLAANVVDIWLDVERGMWPERSDEMTPYVRWSFEASEALTLPRYARILQRRARLEREVAELFTGIDVLLTPTTAVAAFPAGGPIPTHIAGQRVFPAMAVPFTMLANLCWNPAVSVPAGLTREGMPVGLQIIARRHADEVALRLARLLEQARPWPRLAPAAAAG